MKTRIEDMPAAFRKLKAPKVFIAGVLGATLCIALIWQAFSLPIGAYVTFLRNRPMFEYYVWRGEHFGYPPGDLGIWTMKDYTVEIDCGDDPSAGYSVIIIPNRADNPDWTATCFAFSDYPLKTGKDYSDGDHAIHINRAIARHWWTCKYRLS